MKAPDRRKYPRMKQSFQVQLSKNGLNHSLEGMSVDVSLGGAFIKTSKWRSFKVREKANLAFFLPPAYTGQTNVVGLQGGAVVTRVDQKIGGIGVKFVKSFNQFERIQAPDIAANT
jgi:c-di-GMP-binding flagellar brake protein YcgR